jgi:hypothetical protein
MNDTVPIRRSRNIQRPGLLIERLRHSELPALCTLFLLTVAVYWKIAFTDQFTWLDGADTAFQIVPWFQEQVRQWKSGHFPLWEAHHWAGQSLIGRMEPGVAYPVNWLLALFPLKDGYISLTLLNWYFIAIHFMGAAFCYALCRDLKCRRAPSVLAGASFALGGYVGNNNWPQMVNGAIWAPLIFLFLLRALRGPRKWFHAAACGVCAGMSVLSGHHQAPLYIALSVAVALVFWAVTCSSWNVVIPVSLVAGLFGGAMAAIQLLPAREYYHLALRWVGTREPVTFDQKVPYFSHMALSFHPVSLFGIVVPHVEANISPFIGITVFSLALIAVIAAWDRIEVRLFSLLAVFGVLLCLGQYSILEGLLYALLPGMDKARNVSFAIFVFQFPAAILACLGLDAALGGQVPAQLLKRIAFAALAFSAILYLFLIARFTFEPDVARYQTGVPLAALYAVLFGSLFLLWVNGRIRNNAVGYWLVALLIFEIGNVTQFLYPNTEAGWNVLNGLTRNRDIARFLRDHLEDGRFDVNATDVPHNLGDWEDLDQYNGYTGVTVNIARMAFNTNSRELFGVRYYIANKPRTEGETPVFQGSSGLKVYAEPPAFPRAWSVKHVERVDNQTLIPGLLAGNTPEYLRNNAFLSGDKVTLETCGGEDTVTYKKIRPTSYIVDTEMRCKRMVVVGNTYFPGWTVRVDGRPTRMYEVDRALSGFVVPGGKHKVEVAYRPASVFVGAALSISALLGLCILGIFSRNER